MKKVFVILFILLLICGCATKGEQESQKESELGSETKTEDNNKDIVSNSRFNESNTWEVEAFNNNSSGRCWAYCRVPSTDIGFHGHSSEGGRDDYDNPTGSKIIAFTCDSLEANENNMFEVFCDYMLWDVSNYCKSEKIENVKFEEVKINGIDATKFTGTMRDADSYLSDIDLYVTGYVFLDEDCVAGIWGLVDDPKQDPEAIKFVNEATEYMMSTVYFK